MQVVNKKGRVAALQGELGFQASNEANSRPTAFKVGLYDAIRRTAVAQREALSSDNLESFYDLLIERERLLEKIDMVNHVAQKAANAGLEGVDPADAQTVAGVVREIMQIDAESEQLLTQKIYETKTELGDVREGRQAMRAYQYAMPVAVGGYFVDRRS